MRIHLVNKPLNHRVWKLIYLICFLLGFCIQGYGESTQTINRPQRVEYRNVLVERWIQIQQVKRFIYGKAPGKEKTQKEPTIVEIPEPQPSPYPAQMQTRRKRAGEHSLAQDFKTSRVALLIWRKDHRGSYRTFVKSPPSQRPMYGTPRPLSA
jgi:hypothetical protein